MMFEVMSGLDCAYTITFIVFVLLLCLPPEEVVSSGLTLENIFSSFLGSETLSFVDYHIRRTTLTAVVHSFIPLTYYVTMCFVSDSVQFLAFDSLFWRLLFQLGVLLPCLISILAIYWSQNNWNNHPIANIIFLRARRRDNWRSVASCINDEMISFDKFISGVRPSKKLIITNNWLVKTNLYSIDVAHQTDVELIVLSCYVHPISTSRSSDGDFVENVSSSGIRYNEAQYLNIAVQGVREKVVYFHFSINSIEFEDIKGKVSSSVKRARGVIIQQTLGEKFVLAFKEVVSQNKIPSIHGSLRENVLEPCIGCSQSLANVQLIRSCVDEGIRNVLEGSSSTASCGNCFCRPMWCVECMGRWFASRQLLSQKDPSTWMSQKATCPTCRAYFCVLDVIIVSVDTVFGET